MTRDHSFALIIDDNRSIADSICEMVQHILPLEAESVYGSRSGIQLLEQETPKIIFLDINMPGLSGFEILSYIKREPRLMEVPVFIISTEDQPETIEKARQLGMTAFITKPLTIEDLQRVLGENNLI